jgi:hypothetical protein
MYVGCADFSAVVAFLDGFNAARGGGPLLGFREWLVVKANTGNNLHWAGLVKLLNRPRPAEGGEREEGFWIETLGRVIAEYLAFRAENGITKVYYDYGRWLVRHRWYRGPLRKQAENTGGKE